MNPLTDRDILTALLLTQHAAGSDEEEDIYTATALYPLCIDAMHSLKRELFAHESATAPLHPLPQSSQWDWFDAHVRRMEERLFFLDSVRDRLGGGDSDEYSTKTSDTVPEHTPITNENAGFPISESVHYRKTLTLRPPLGFLEVQIPLPIQHILGNPQELVPQSCGKTESVQSVKENDLQDKKSEQLLHLRSEAPPHGTCLPSVPSSTMRRPFWLLRLFLDTIFRGGPLTRTIYIPQNMWIIPIETFESNPSILFNITGKAVFFRSTSRLLHVLQSEVKYDMLFDPSSDSTLQHLRDFVRELRDQHHKYVSLPERTTRRDALPHPPSRQTSTELHNIYHLEYLPSLISVLEDVQFLDTWFVQLQYENFERIGPERMQHLHEISLSFYLCVCRPVYEDCFSLLDVYMETHKRAMLIPMR